MHLLCFSTRTSCHVTQDECEQANLHDVVDKVCKHSQEKLSVMQVGEVPHREEARDNQRCYGEEIAEEKQI